MYGSSRYITAATASPAAQNDACTLSLLGLSAAAIQITGTWAGTITFECSVDGTNFVAVNMTPAASATAASTATANGVWAGSVGGFKTLRARFSTKTSGTPVITIQAGVGR